MHLKFKNGGYHCVISNALIPGEVYVAEDGKIIFDKICKELSTCHSPKRQRGEPRRKSMI
jgi:hypothetical protein